MKICEILKICGFFSEHRSQIKRIISLALVIASVKSLKSVVNKKEADLSDLSEVLALKATQVVESVLNMLVRGNK